MDLIERLPEWAQLVILLAAVFPPLLAFLANSWTAIKEFRRKVSQAKERSLWEAAKVLWAEGQQIKAQLDALGKRGDFLGQLRDKAYAVAARYGIPSELVDLLLERARSIHKERKGQRPQVSEVWHLPPEVAAEIEAEPAVAIPPAEAAPADPSQPSAA